MSEIKPDDTNNANLQRARDLQSDETSKLLAETRMLQLETLKLQAERSKLAAEEAKYMAEERLLFREALKRERDLWWFPWVALPAGVAFGAALVIGAKVLASHA